ncbi:MAG TPA: adenylosuccinate lyase [Saprospirales bacterium]|nr:adenylosuccinate lyase [Saprospirales bacterium]|tara:strand:+ start:4828 stop:6159 length:1332 start_codon:yes stop_codon:yes gene_type:complete
MLQAISPIDGRYAKKTQPLSQYFSEEALIRYRVLVEIEYFLKLSETVPQLNSLTDDDRVSVRSIIENFSTADAEKIKSIEAVTNHDVKAVEYFIKEQFDARGLSEHKEFVHFGLTSQDINNTSTPMMVKDALDNVIFPSIEEVINSLESMAKDYSGIPMLAKTHGQPASPTSLGKEIMVFVERLNDQMDRCRSLPIKAKFGGATGNLNAHKVCYPDIDWIEFADDFVSLQLGLDRSRYTTQIAHYDHLAAIFDALARINTILIDLTRDIWTYIMMEYFKQKTVANEIGSSAMPHKVNPIDFENAEGNLGLANSIFNHLSAKLPISRLQRDLTDSTVIRNIGVPLGHSLIAYTSVLKGLGKLILNDSAIAADLDANWVVVAEAIQNILRKEGYDKPYEALKELTRGKTMVNEDDITAFIDTLNTTEDIKAELKTITPFNYFGYA